MGIFSDAKGQLTPKSVVGSGRICNSSELSYMSSLPASMKRIGYKTAEKKWQHCFFFFFFFFCFFFLLFFVVVFLFVFFFFHFNPICCHGKQ